MLDIMYSPMFYGYKVVWFFAIIRCSEEDCQIVFIIVVCKSLIPCFSNSIKNFIGKYWWKIYSDWPFNSVGQPYNCPQARIS